MRSNRNLVLVIAAIAVVAAGTAIAVAATSGGSSTTSGAGTPAATSASSGGVTSSAASSSSSSLSASPTHRSSSASEPPLTSSPPPVGRLTCASLSSSAPIGAFATFTAGGAVPSGVPIPQAVPSLTCRGKSKEQHPVSLVAMSWTSVAEHEYAGQLAATGWHEKNSGPLQVFQKHGASKTIVLATVQGQLVAVYGPPT